MINTRKFYYVIFNFKDYRISKFKPEGFFSVVSICESLASAKFWQQKKQIKLRLTNNAADIYYEKYLISE